MKGHTSCSPNKTAIGKNVVEELTGTFSFTAVISVPNMPKCYSTSYVFPMTWNTTQDGLKEIDNLDLQTLNLPIIILRMARFYLVE